MPTLENYTIASFDQDVILSREYLVPWRNKPQVDVGVCFALVLEYFKRIHGGGELDTEIMVQYLKDQFPLVIQRQEISIIAVDESVDFVQGFNKMTAHTGFQFTNLSPTPPTGHDKDAFKAKIQAAADGDYVMVFSAQRGNSTYGHMVGVQINRNEGDFDVFDPNLGIMRIPLSEVDEFVNLYWAKYAGSPFSMTITTCWLLRVGKVDSVREKFERGFPVPRVVSPPKA